MSFAFPSAEALGIAFRSCRDEDLPFLAHLYASTRWEEVAQTGWPAAAQAAFLAQQFDAQHRHYVQFYPDLERWLLERDGAPVGRVYVHETDRDVNLVDIALLPEHRRLGIGAAIFTDLLRQAEARGKSVSLYVEKNNPARGLYDRFGFAIVDEQGVYDRMIWSPPAP